MTEEVQNSLHRYIDAVVKPISSVEVNQTLRRPPRRYSPMRPLVLGIACVVAVAALTGVAVNVGRGGHSMKGGRPKGNVAASTPPFVDVGAPGLVAASDIVSMGDQLYSLHVNENRLNQVAIFSATDRRQLAETEITGAQDIAVSSDSVWIIRNDVHVAELDLLDATSLQTVKTVMLGFPPARVVAVGNSVWVMGFDSIERFDAASLDDQGPVVVDPHGLTSRAYPVDMSTNGSTVFIAWQDTDQQVGVTAVDVDGNAVAERAGLGRSDAPPPSTYRALAASTGVVFVRLGGSQGDHWQAFAANDLASSDIVPLQGTSAFSLVASGQDHLWGFDYSTGTVSCIDASTGTAAWTYDVVDPTSVGTAGSEVIVTTGSAVKAGSLSGAC